MEKQKIAIILHAEPGTKDAMGRAAHAFLYTRELKDAGHEVKLVFDGGGTKWIDELTDEDHHLAGLYRAAKEAGDITGVCDYCIGAFGGDKEQVEELGLQVSGEYMGHPSIASIIGDGFQVITL